MTGEGIKTHSNGSKVHGSFREGRPWGFVVKVGVVCMCFVIVVVSVVCQYNNECFLMRLPRYNNI
jgi:hypothetical protein